MIYTVKKLKTHEHSEGTAYTGSLYFHNKLIATFDEQGRGAPMSICAEEYELMVDFLSYSRAREDTVTLEADAFVIHNLAFSEIMRKKVMTGRKKKTYYSTLNGLIHEVNQPYSEGIVKFIYENDGEHVNGIGNEIFDYYPDGVERVIRD